MTTLLQVLENKLSAFIESKDDTYVPLLEFIIGHIKQGYPDRLHDDVLVSNFITSFMYDLQQNLDEMEEDDIFDDSIQIKKEINFLNQYIIKENVA